MTAARLCAQLEPALSFSNQNTGTHRVVRRQNTHALGLTIGSKTAMAGNRTAITLQSVVGPSFAGRPALPKHISQRHHGSGPCATKRRIKQFVDEVSGEAEVYWPSQSCETANQERQKVIIGDEIQESVHGFFGCDMWPASASTSPTAKLPSWPAIWLSA